MGYESGLPNLLERREHRKASRNTLKISTGRSGKDNEKT